VILENWLWAESTADHWKRRNEWNVRGGRGVRSADSLVKMRKWSVG